MSNSPEHPQGTTREDMRRDTMKPSPQAIKTGSEAEPQIMPVEEFSRRLHQAGAYFLIQQIVRNVPPELRYAFFDTEPQDLVSDLTDEEIASGL